MTCPMSAEHSTAGNIPAINFGKSGFKQKDTLTLVITAGRVKGRSMLQIRMAENETSNCNLWHRAIENCTENYTLLMNFQDQMLEQCFRGKTFVEHQNSSYLQYSGLISVQYEEQLMVEPSLASNNKMLVRSVTNQLQFLIRFPKEIVSIPEENQKILDAIDTPTIRDSPVTFSAAFGIIRSKVSVETPLVDSYLTAILVSLAKAPFQLLNSTISCSNSNLQPAIESLTGDPRHTDNCPSFNSSVNCLLYWKITVHLDSFSGCDFSDVYNVTFLVQCRDSSCDMPSGNITQVSLNINSPTICPQIVEDAAFLGRPLLSFPKMIKTTPPYLFICNIFLATLRIYSDSEFMNEISQWKVDTGERTYLKLTGSISSEVVLQSVAISHIIIEVNGNSSFEVPLDGAPTPSYVCTKHSFLFLHVALLSPFFQCIDRALSQGFR